MATLPGRMMQMPLLVSSLLTHAARHHGDTEIVSVEPDGSRHRGTWASTDRRARRLAQAFARLGCQPGDRVGSLAWNSRRHLEFYYATSGSGLVCHTINPRLFPEQIAWIATAAGDRVLCIDPCFLPLLQSMADALPCVEHIVVMTDASHMPASTAPGWTKATLHCFDTLVDAEPDGWTWPSFDETTASSLCYTSGTTGEPKGALYSHRSTVLHALASAMPDAMQLSSSDTVLPIVPMFHVNAWGLPYAAAMVGCKLVLPGPQLDGKSLYDLFESERVTFSAGVPTVWLGLLDHLTAHGLRFTTFKRTVIGGAACPPTLLAALEDEHGIEVVHAWGMTELSPLGTLARLKSKHMGSPADVQRTVKESQGKVVWGVDMLVADDAGRALPTDGASAGNLMVRGHWVIDRYFRDDASPLRTVDGSDWFPTGDVATIDADGYMRITDRSKDVIKSGGEWISSIQLEHIAASHPAVHEAAVIAMPHPKWDERPLLVVALKPGATVDKAALLAHYAGRIAKWQTPDDVKFVDALPHTATGKLNKRRLRADLLASGQAPAA